MVADMSRALKSCTVQRSEKSSLMTEMGHQRRFERPRGMSAMPRRIQPVSATLTLEGKDRLLADKLQDIVVVRGRQSKSRYGDSWLRRDPLKAFGRAVWQAVIVIYCQLLQVLRRPVETTPDRDQIAASH